MRLFLILFLLITQLNNASLNAQCYNHLQIVATTPIKAPLPGQLHEILINIDDYVEKGTIVAKIHVMKMEINVLAPINGTITNIYYNRNNIVRENDTIIDISTFEDINDKIQNNPEKNSYKNKTNVHKNTQKENDLFQKEILNELIKNRLDDFPY